MATFTATRAASTAPAFQAVGPGILCAAYGTIEVTANPVAADVYEMCRIPAGAVVVGGRIYSDDLDTNVAETLNLSVGWLNNGTDATNASGLGLIGVQGTDTVAGIKYEAGYNYYLGGVLASDGPKTFAAETVIAVTCVATAATFAAGTLSVVVHYVNP